MTVLEIIQRSTEFLAKKGVESPRLQIELLLAHALKLPRLKLYLNFERVLTEDEIATVRELVKRRGQREPLQHIVGSVSFCGLEITVNADVLIPRPETEILAERGWQFLNAGSPSRTALDFGTGSGCLAILLAVQAPTARVHALDISLKALEVAQANAARHRMLERIQFHGGDRFAGLPAGLKFDLIVANPPYIPSLEIEALEPEVRDHDPRLALDGGADGLDFYRRLADEAKGRLLPTGRLMAEFGEGQSDALSTIFSAKGWNVEEIIKDYTQRERFLIACVVQP